jgi:hypothetical protein
MRASRSSAVLPPPNIRSNMTRGLISIGRGDVGEAQFSVFMYAAVKPGSQVPRGPKIFGRHFDGWERRVLADLPRDDLVDRCSDTKVGAVRAFGRAPVSQPPDDTA